MIGPIFATFGPADVERANDKRQVKRAQKREQQRRRQLREWYLDVMRTPSGRAMLWDVIDRCEAFGSGFVRDPAERDFLAGQRHVGVMLLNDLAAVDRALFLTMESEARTRQATEEKEREREAKADDARGTEGSAERAGDDEVEEDDATR